MSRGVYVALSGAVAQQQALETTAENLANASTPGYQRIRPVFREALANAAGGPNQLHYGAVGATTIDGSRGALRATGRSLDVALPEGSYLVVSTPRGDRFTRAGSLTVTPDGAVTAGGAPVLDENGKPVRVDPASDPSARADGTIGSGTEAGTKLKMVRAASGTTLNHEGAGLLVARGAMDPATAELEVGVLEESNATAVTAMTDLVTASRTFEAFQRMLDTFGECDRKVLTTTPGFSE
jgi:flagellar basal body rod protein FlgG